MKFTKRDPTEVMSINEWVSGTWAIVELAYMFGQHRIQIWDERFSIPHVVLPNF